MKWNFSQLAPVIAGRHGGINVKEIDVELQLHGLALNGKKFEKAERLKKHYEEKHAARVLDMSAMPRFDVPLVIPQLPPLPVALQDLMPRACDCNHNH